MSVEKSDFILSSNNLYVTCLGLFLWRTVAFSHYPHGLNFMKQYIGLGLSYLLLSYFSFNYLY